MDNKDKIIQEQREEICLLNEEIKRLIYASLPNAQIRILRGTHFIAKENYIEFNHAVEKFLKNC